MSICNNKLMTNKYLTRLRVFSLLEKVKESNGLTKRRKKTQIGLFRNRIQMLNGSSQNSRNLIGLGIKAKTKFLKKTLASQ